MNIAIPISNKTTPIWVTVAKPGIPEIRSDEPDSGTAKLAFGKKVRNELEYAAIVKTIHNIKAIIASASIA